MNQPEILQTNPRGPENLDNPQLEAVHERSTKAGSVWQEASNFVLGLAREYLENRRKLANQYYKGDLEAAANAGGLFGLFDKAPDIATMQKDVEDLLNYFKSDSHFYKVYTEIKEKFGQASNFDFDTNHRASYNDSNKNKPKSLEINLFNLFTTLNSNLYTAELFLFNANGQLQYRYCFDKASALRLLSAKILGIYKKYKEMEHFKLEERLHGSLYTHVASTFYHLDKISLFSDVYVEYESTTIIGRMKDFVGLEKEFETYLEIYEKKLNTVSLTESLSLHDVRNLLIKALYSLYIANLVGEKDFMNKLGIIVGSSSGQSHIQAEHAKWKSDWDHNNQYIPEATELIATDIKTDNSSANESSTEVIDSEIFDEFDKLDEILDSTTVDNSTYSGDSGSSEHEGFDWGIFDSTLLEPIAPLTAEEIGDMNPDKLFESFGNGNEVVGFEGNQGSETLIQPNAENLLLDEKNSLLETKKGWTKELQRQTSRKTELDRLTNELSSLIKLDEKVANEIDYLSEELAIDNHTLLSMSMDIFRGYILSNKNTPANKIRAEASLLVINFLVKILEHSQSEFNSNPTLLMSLYHNFWKANNLKGSQQEITDLFKEFSEKAKQIDANIVQIESNLRSTDAQITEVDEKLETQKILQQSSQGETLTNSQEINADFNFVTWKDWKNKDPQNFNRCLDSYVQLIEKVLTENLELKGQYLNYLTTYLFPDNANPKLSKIAVEPDNYLLLKALQKISEKIRKRETIINKITIQYKASEGKIISKTLPDDFKFLETFSDVGDFWKKMEFTSFKVEVKNT